MVKHLIFFIQTVLLGSTTALVGAHMHQNRKIRFLLNGIIRSQTSDFLKKKQAEKSLSNITVDLSAIANRSNKFFLKHVNYSDYNPKVRYLHAPKC